MRDQRLAAKSRWYLSPLIDKDPIFIGAQHPQQATAFTKIAKSSSSVARHPAFTGHGKGRTTGFVQAAKQTPQCRASGHVSSLSKQADANYPFVDSVIMCPASHSRSQTHQHSLADAAQADLHLGTSSSGAKHPAVASDHASRCRRPGSVAQCSHWLQHHHTDRHDTGGVKHKLRHSPLKQAIVGSV